MMLTNLHFYFKFSVFSYRWNVITAGTPNYIGAGHTHEIAFVFDDTKNSTDFDVDPFLGPNRPNVMTFVSAPTHLRLKYTFTSIFD